jgi:hypothetical protein
MAADVTEREHFATAATTVFDYVVDFSHLADWDPLFASSRRLDDGDAVSAGARFEVVAEVAGQRIPVTYIVEQHDRPRHARLVGEGDGFTSIDEITVEQDDDGDGCTLVWNARVETDVAAVDTLATPLFKAVAKASMAGLRDKLGDG